MTKKLLILAFIFLNISIAHSEEMGSIYMSKIESNKTWEGNPTGATIDTIFTLVIDGVNKVEISKDKDAKISNLELGKKHSIAIYQDGKKIESFYFRFEDYQCDRLWLYYKNLYGTWILRESSWDCKR